MRLLIIRHADPDYVRDSLTATGRREADLLARYLSDVRINYVYVSPLGRAQKTAAPTLAAKGLSATTLEWLKEFSPRIRHKGGGILPTCAWDWLPEQWSVRDRFYTDAWYDEPEMVAGGVRDAYLSVCSSLDELLASFGYVRRGRCYEVRTESHDTVALFTHFGLTCVLLSHLMGVSPMVLWHGMCAAPSSITTINTEERRRGTASFRMSEYGAVPHLALAGAQPSFSARFRACASDRDRA